MQLSRIDRNRIRVAVIVTAIIVPIAFMAGGRPADSVDTTVAVSYTHLTLPTIYSV